jgi:hypothetical protein
VRVRGGVNQWQKCRMATTTTTGRAGSTGNLDCVPRMGISITVLNDVLLEELEACDIIGWK